MFKSWLLLPAEYAICDGKYCLVFSVLCCYRISCKPTCSRTRQWATCTRMFLFLCWGMNGLCAKMWELEKINIQMQYSHLGRSMYQGHSLRVVHYKNLFGTNFIYKYSDIHGQTLLYLFSGYSPLLVFRFSNLFILFVYSFTICLIKCMKEINKKL